MWGNFFFADRGVVFLIEKKGRRDFPFFIFSPCRLGATWQFVFLFLEGIAKSNYCVSSSLSVGVPEEEGGANLFVSSL